MPEKVCGLNWVGCNAGHQEVSRCRDRNVSKESVTRSPKFTNGSQERTYVSKFFTSSLEMHQVGIFDIFAVAKFENK